MDILFGLYLVVGSSLISVFYLTHSQVIDFRHCSCATAFPEMSGQVLVFYLSCIMGWKQFKCGICIWFMPCDPYHGIWTLLLFVLVPYYNLLMTGSVGIFLHSYGFRLANVVIFLIWDY